MKQTEHEGRRTRWTWRGVIALAALAAGGAASATAGDIAPLLPPVVVAPDPVAFPPAPAPEESASPPGVDPDQPLVERLTRIRFECWSSDSDASPASGTASSSPVAGTGTGIDNEVPTLAGALAVPDSELSRVVAAAMSSPLTWRRLDAVLMSATRAARTAGWSLARAYAPEQELSGGTLRVVVVPVTLEGVDIEGAGWSRPERLQRLLRGHVGEVVRIPGYSAPLSFLNQHPFRRVTPLLTPGEATGTSRMRLAVTEERPWRVFSGYETTHSRLSGSGRVTGGFVMAAPWRMDDVFTAQYAGDNEFSHTNSVSASYRAALPWGHFLTVTGLWATSDASPARLLDYETTDWLAGLEYSVPLPEWRGWRHEVFVGWEWRSFEGEYDLSGFRFGRQKIALAPFSLGWRGRRPDGWGITSLSVEGTWNPGDYLGGSMDRASYEAHRRGTTPSFATVGWEIRRDWALPFGFGFENRLWGQLASERLTDPSRFYLGGNRSIRGYRESELSGDGGWGATLELLSPSWRSPSWVCAGDSAEAEEARLAMRLTGFWDWGQVYRHGPRDVWERRRETASGAGLGIRADFGRWLNARAEYAWRLRDTVVPADNVRGWWHLTLNVSF